MCCECIILVYTLLHTWFLSMVLVVNRISVCSYPFITVMLEIIKNIIM